MSVHYYIIGSNNLLFENDNQFESSDFSSSGMYFAIKFYVEVESCH